MLNITLWYTLANQELFTPPPHTNISHSTRVSFRIFVKGGGVAKATIADLRGCDDYSSILVLL